MTQPRRTLISLSDTPYYHCVSRCVRQAYLCGHDSSTGRSYEHRRRWLEAKLLSTANAFGIKVCAYAIMSNHYHVVLRVCSDDVQRWSAREVITRWHQVYSGTRLSRLFIDNGVLSDSEQLTLDDCVALWRTRLMSISWFMKVVNHAIAVRANDEDECKGHFWEARFKSQALLDEQALLACMAYVDLNPIRAELAQSLETSDFTSIKRRIKALKGLHSPHPCLDDFVGIKKDADGIPFALSDYIELVDWSGRLIHPNKRGFINTDAPPMLSSLRFEQDAWETLVTQFETCFSYWVGSEHIVRQCYDDHHYQRHPTVRSHKQLFG